MDDEKLEAILNDPDREARMSHHDPSVLPLVLLGYRTATTSAQDALLKLEAMIQGDDPKTAILPIAMSRTQCRELGEALVRLATLPYRSDQMKN